MNKESDAQLPPEVIASLEFRAWQVKQGEYDDDIHPDTSVENPRGHFRFWKNLKERVRKSSSFKDAALVAAGATTCGLVVLPSHPRLVLGAVVEVATIAFLSSRIFTNRKI